MSGVTEERLAVSERADDDVALADLGHAAAREFQRVVSALVVEDFDDEHYAFLGRDIRRDAQLAREAAGLRHRGHFVDDDAQHVVHHGVRTPSALGGVGALAGAPVKHTGQGGDLGEAESVDGRPLARGFTVHATRGTHQRIR